MSKDNQHITTFTKGMQTDLSPTYRDKDTWLDAENIRILNDNGNQMSVENIKGNQYMFQVKDGYTILGAYELGDNVILTSSCIDETSTEYGYIDIGMHNAYSPIGFGYVSSLDLYPTYRNVFGWYSNGNRHEIYAEYEYDNTISVYICNTKNSDRVIRINSNGTLTTQYTDEESWDVLTRLKLVNNEPNIDLVSVGVTGGVLECGSYRYAVRYVDSNDNATTWSMLSGSVPIYTERWYNTNAPNWNKVIGSDIGMVSTKKVTLRLRNLDISYKYIQLGCVFSIGNTNSGFVIKKEAIANRRSMNIEHRGNEQSIIEEDTAEFNIEDIAIVAHKTQSVIDNRLLIGNITTYEYNRAELKTIADKIKLSWGTTEIETSGAFVKDSTTDLYPSNQARVGDYAIPQNCFSRVGYRRNEQYAFGIQFLFNNGVESEVYHIGKADIGTGLLLSDTDTNDVNRDTKPNAYVYIAPRHADYPFVRTPNVDYNNELVVHDRSQFVQVLRPSFTAIDINGIKDLQGYYIVRVDNLTTQSNRILAQGIGIPMTKFMNGTPAYSPAYIPSVFNPYNDNTSHGLCTANHSPDPSYSPYNLENDFTDQQSPYNGLFFPDDYIGKHESSGAVLMNRYTNKIVVAGVPTPTPIPSMDNVYYAANFKFNGNSLVGAASTDPNYFGYWECITDVPDASLGAIPDCVTDPDDFNNYYNWKKNLCQIAYCEMQSYFTLSQVQEEFQHPILSQTYAFGDSQTSFDPDPTAALDVIWQQRWKYIHDGWCFQTKEGTSAALNTFVQNILGIDVNTEGFGVITDLCDYTREHQTPNERRYIYTNSYTSVLSYADSYNPSGIYTTTIYGGDTYVQRTNMRHSLNYNATQTNEIGWNATFIGHYSENYVNTQLRHIFRNLTTNEVIKPTFFPYDLCAAEVGKVAAVNYGDEREEYNDSYSTQNTIQSLTPYNASINYTNRYPTQIRYSEIKPNGSLSDGYRVFKPLNYMDLSKEYIELNRIISHSGQLLCFLDNAICMVNVNQPAQVGTTAGALQLGNGSVLGQKPNVLTDTYGTQHQFSVIKTATGVYCVDNKRHKIIKVGQGLEFISDNAKVRTILEDWNFNSPYRQDRINGGSYDDRTIQGAGIHAGYNTYYKEIMFTFMYQGGTDNKYMTLVYDERLGGFTNFHTCKATMYFNHDLNTYSTHNTLTPDNFSVTNTTRTGIYLPNRDMFNKAYIHDIGHRGEFYEVIKDSSITYGINPQVMSSILLDAIKIYSNSDVKRTDPIRIEAHPYKIRMFNSYQDYEYLLINETNGNEDTLVTLEPRDTIVFMEQLHHISILNISHNDIDDTTRIRDRYHNIKLFIDNTDNLRQNIMNVLNVWKPSDI